MEEKDQTSEETLEEDNPKETSEEKAEETETPAEETPKETTEPEIDYKAKFRESQREGIRLAKELKKANEPKKPEKVETEADTDTLDQIVEKKVQEQIAPLTAKQDDEKVNKFLKDNPDAMDYLKEIDETYSKMPGKTVEVKLENAFLVAKKDAMKETGKKEMAFSLYQKEQAVASGSGASSSGAESSSLPLTTEEKQVASAMGLKEEAYAKRKLESKK